MSVGERVGLKGLPVRVREGLSRKLAVLELRATRKTWTVVNLSGETLSIEVLAISTISIESIAIVAIVAIVIAVVVSSVLVFKFKNISTCKLLLLLHMNYYYNFITLICLYLST